MVKDQLFISGSWVDSNVRGSNTSGTPLTSAVLNDSGQEISDTYTLTISARSGSTGTVTVGASANNPYNARVITGVTMDSSTVILNVIPGVSIVFATGAANSNVATIVVGNPYGAFDASGVDAGVPTDGVQHRVLNSGTSSVSNSKARLLTQAIQVKITGKVFDYLQVFADGATEKIAGGGSTRTIPYEMTISGVSGSGPTKVATLSKDGVALGSVILDMTTGSTVSGTGLKALGSTYPYAVLSGPLEGLIFSIDPACANSDEANVLIFPSRYVQIASDVAGAEGTYGTSDVDLTTTGQATGVITASGVAYYWSRFVVPASADNESNPYPCEIALSVSESSAAGWGD